MGKKQYTLTLEESIIEKIDQLAKKDSRTRSNMINLFLEKHLSGDKFEQGKIE